MTISERLDRIEAKVAWIMAQLPLSVQLAVAMATIAGTATGSVAHHLRTNTYVQPPAIMRPEREPGHRRKKLPDVRPLTPGGDPQ